MRPIEFRTVEIPDGVKINLEGKRVEVISEKGSLVRDFSHAPVSIQIEEGEVKVSATWPKRKERALVGTVCSHIRNMISGVTNGSTYKLKIVFSHFPISVKVDGKKILIENFMGERTARTANIIGEVKVIVKGDDIVVQGLDVEKVSQTAANIEQATKVKEKDPRIFLDGIYVLQKLRGIVD